METHSEKFLKGRQGARQFFQPSDWLVFAITGGCMLLVYLFTISPEVTLEWSGMLSTGANYGSAPSPPGYPLWTLYAGLFCRMLPFSNVAWRVAVSSAVAGALCCGVTALIVSRGTAGLLRGTKQLSRLPEIQERWLRGVCGCVAGMGFGLDKTFWRQAVIAETTALAAFLFSIVILLLMRWAHEIDRHLYLYSAAAAFGLGLNVHLSLAIVTPGILFLVYLRNAKLGRDLLLITTVTLGATLILHAFHHLPDFISDLLEINHGLSPVYLSMEVFAFVVCIRGFLLTGRLMTEWRGALATVVCGFFPLLLYFYIPIASMKSPPDNWGYPRTIEGFFHLVGRGQFEAASPVVDVGHFLRQLWEYGRDAARTCGLAYVLAAIVCISLIGRTHKVQRRWLLGLISVFLCSSGGMLAILIHPSICSRGNLQNNISLSLT